MLLGVFNRGMSNTAAVLRQINQLRADAVTAAHTAGYLNPDFSLDEHLRAVRDLTEADRTTDGFGDPNADWCVDIVDGDLVRVFAAGDIAAEAVIAGAGSL